MNEDQPRDDESGRYLPPAPAEKRNYIGTVIAVIVLTGCVCSIPFMKNPAEMLGGGLKMFDDGQHEFPLQDPSTIPAIDNIPKITAEKRVAESKPSLLDPVFLDPDRQTLSPVPQLPIQNKRYSMPIHRIENDPIIWRTLPVQ